MPRVNREVYLKKESLEKRKDEIKRSMGWIVEDKIKSINVGWDEMTHAGILRHIGKRGLQLATVTTLIYASNPNGPIDMWGDPETPIAIEDQRADAEFTARDTYNMQTIEGKFAMQYLSITEGRVSGSDAGNGILGFVSTGGNPELVYRFGQSCLAGSAYDTTPSELRGRTAGDISAIAALNYDANIRKVTVFPANSEATPLVFTTPPNNGLLNPDEKTADTLEAYGCQPEGLVVEEHAGTYPKYWVPIPSN